MYIRIYTWINITYIRLYTYFPNAAAWTLTQPFMLIVLDGTLGDLELRSFDEPRIFQDRPPGTPDPPKPLRSLPPGPLEITDL